MDGNGRWAAKRGLPRLAGHRAGTDNVHRIVECFDRYQVKYLTLYAFSTENWRRPGIEVSGLLRILAQMIDRETKALHEKNVRISHLGRLDDLPPELQGKVHKALELTGNNTGMTLSIAFDYGGRAEILDAVRHIIKDRVPSEDITESLFSSYLYTADVPEPDLLIRTGGEMRVSNFLIWQAAYSEFYSTPVLWPDFDEKEIEKALVAYSRRERRFGGLKAEGEG
ncbi:MAG: di-trans,poly-cis-decaprenylcistransferase [Dehalococcoidia bacterium]|nr:MAG: di-trans,poly-cis-decaprenylcistransferase [Dehalococcoidia bacterium]